MPSSILKRSPKQEMPDQERTISQRYRQTTDQHIVQRVYSDLPPSLKHEPTDRSAESHDRVTTFGKATTLPRFVQNEHSLRSTLASAGNGKPLDSKTREIIEESLQTDLSQVRLHDDHRAHQLAVSLGAAAFANGNHIYFRSGMYSPQSQAGARLLAHETFHTVQQTANAEPKATTASGFKISEADEPLERQAESMAKTMAGSQRESHAVARGDERRYRRATDSIQEPAGSSVKTGPSPLIQRQEVPEAKSMGLQSWVHGLKSRLEQEFERNRRKKAKQELDKLPQAYKNRIDRGVYKVTSEDLENEEVKPPITP